MKIPKVLASISGVAILLAVCALACFAQESRGTVIGRVTDSTGAALPGVKVIPVLG